MSLPKTGSNILLNQELSRKAQKILELAQDLLREGRLFDCNIDDFAAEANVSKMTIYKHFGSKQGLVETASLTLLARQLWQDFESMSQQQRVDALLQIHLERSRIGVGRLIELRNKGSEEYRAELSKLEKRADQVMQLIFNEAQRIGNLKEYSANELLALIKVLIDGMIQHNKNPHAIDAVTKTFHLLLTCLGNSNNND